MTAWLAVAAYCRVCVHCGMRRKMFGRKVICGLNDVFVCVAFCLLTYEWSYEGYADNISSLLRKNTWTSQESISTAMELLE